MSSPKCLFIFYNLFSLQLTENFHEQKHFLKAFTTCFVYIIFSVKCIIKKNYLPPYSPLKIKELPSDKYVSLFLISNLTKQIWNLNNYVTTGIFFKDLCTRGNQRKIRKLGYQKHPFYCYSSSDNIITGGVITAAQYGISSFLSTVHLWHILAANVWSVTSWQLFDFISFPMNLIGVSNERNLN